MTVPSTNFVKLTAEVLDQGLGTRVKNDIKVDNSLAGFELIPLRPGYYRNSSNILILVSFTVFDCFHSFCVHPRQGR